jgi:cytochrome c peroxidase
MVNESGRQRWFEVAVALGGLLAITAGCNASGGHDGFTDDEWASIQQISPLKGDMPPNPINRLADDKRVIALGQALFFEKDYAEAITADGNPNGPKGTTGKVGCVTCHAPQQYLVRNEALTAGLGAAGRRNVPNILNLGYVYTPERPTLGGWFGWTGRHDSLVSHGAGVMGTGATRLAVAHYLYRKYRAEYDAIFEGIGGKLPTALDPADPEAARFPPSGNPRANDAAPAGPWETMTDADRHFMDQLAFNIGRIWEAYPRALVTHGSAFERYMAGDTSALSAEAKRGLKLFVGKAACNDCHVGPALSDGKSHNVGVPKPDGGVADMGRFADLTATLMSPFRGAGEFSDDKQFGQMKLDTAPAPTTAAAEAMKGAFRTPVLLNVDKTWPYFHTGTLTTLTEVVHFYNTGGGEAGTFEGTKDPKIKPLNLSDQDEADLVAFLKSLTGVLPADLIKDTAKH